MPQNCYRESRETRSKDKLTPERLAEAKIHEMKKKVAVGIEQQTMKEAEKKTH